MKWLATLERRLGRFAVPHLTPAIILVQTLTFLALTGNPELARMLPLDTALVLQGQWWRLISFMMMPPTTFFIFLIFALYLLYLMGTALEEEWGTFRYNLYWLVGYLASVGFAFMAPGTVVLNTYLVGSIFLAFAFLYPNFELLLFFILPVKVKWLALITWLFYGFAALSAVAGRDWGTLLMVLAATLNFLLFFGRQIVQKMTRGHRQMHRKRQSIAQGKQPFHRCAVCGRTDLSDPTLEFRYVKQGEEVVGYCVEHLPVEASSETR